MKNGGVEFLMVLHHECYQEQTANKRFDLQFLFLNDSCDKNDWYLFVIEKSFF